MIIYKVCDLRENTLFIFFLIYLYKYRLSNNPKNIIT